MTIPKKLTNGFCFQSFPLCGNFNNWEILNLDIQLPINDNRWQSINLQLLQGITGERH